MSRQFPATPPTPDNVRDPTARRRKSHVSGSAPLAAPPLPQVTPLESTSASPPTDSKGLTQQLSPLDATFTKNARAAADLSEPFLVRSAQVAGCRRAHFSVLGVRINALRIADVIDQMEEWIQAKTVCRSVAATSMHGIVEAQHDPAFLELLNATDLVVPDGMPLIWLARRGGHDLGHRVYGPDLTLSFCEQTKGQSYRHFFYGGEPGVADRLAESLKHRFPSMQIVGTYSPAFRPLSKEEDEEIVAMISRAAPDVLWVGLGAPKQERWMHEHKNKLSAPVMVSIGAAFDMLSGRKKQAPRWMREHGLEWLFRFCQEPRRLWRRYLIYGTQFIFYVVLESLGLKKFPPPGETSNS
jgi:N-acetylglucosaminyldiphosphoundecaprenol N-acetyl-beta-D-mannosaminyltransferase